MFVGIWNCMCLKAEIAEKLKHKITVESRNKICILNLTFLRIGEGEEVGFLLNTDHSSSPAMSVPAFFL